MIEAISQFILFIMVLAPNAPINRDAEFRGSVATDIVEAAALHGIDPFELAFHIKAESSFKVSVVSKSSLKEFGLCQCHGTACGVCKAMGIQLETQRGQVMCMGALFEHGRLLCGPGKGALHWYMSGQCNPSKRARTATRKRMWRFKRAFENSRGN